MPLTDDQIQAFLAAHQAQPLDTADNETTDECAPGKVSGLRQTGETIKTVATRMPVNVALGVATGAPGIIFGVGGAVVGKTNQAIKDSIHKKAVKKQHATITITCVSAANLVNLRKEATGIGSPMIRKTTQSPYVRAYLLMEGVDYNATGYSAKTQTHLSGGTDFAFREGSPSRVRLGFNNDAEAARSAAVLIEVKDQADIALGKALSGRDTRIGLGLMPLYQLVEQAAEPESDGVSSHYINLKLYHGDAINDTNAAPNGGVLRLHVKYERNNVKQ